jgi:CBS domain containing-hemolysin-like protein
VDEFRTLLAEVADEGILDATERVLIDNLLWSGETEIVEIMTPRTRVRFLKDAMTVPEIVDNFRKIQHPRVPVCREHHDNLVGFIHAEDILRLVLDRVDLSKLTLDQIMHPPVVVPPTKYVDEMFDFFQTNRVRAAAVLNEFGGVEGFITMRDIVSFIFGEVSEEIAGQELYKERDENVYEVPGDMKLTDFNDLTNFGVEDPRMTTIGGVVFRYLDRLPEVGDQVVMDGLIATVLDMEGHRLARVRVAKSSLGEEEPEAGTLEEKEESPGETMATQADGAKDGTKAYGPTSMGRAGQEKTAHAETASTTPEEAGRSAEVVVLPPRKIDGPQEGPSHRAGRDISSGHRDVERD